MAIARHVLWPKLRAHVRYVRPAALHWLKLTVEAQYAEGGAGRKRDRAAFEIDRAALESQCDHECDGIEPPVLCIFEQMVLCVSLSK